MNASDRPAWKEHLYEIIFEADTRAGKWFDIGLLLAILFSVAAVCLETVDSIEKTYGGWLNAAEWIFTALFTIEYLLRLITVRNKAAYAFSFYGIIDLVAFLPSYFGLITGGVTSFAVVRSFRLIRVFRILKLIHLTSESEHLGAAVWRSRAKIVVFLAVVMITVTIAGTAMYEVENRFGGEENQFSSIPQSIYWAIITMTTVGYGDIVPTTSLGKVLSAFLILVGYSLIIVPTGFVSAEIIDSRKRQGISTQACAYCMAEGHRTDAAYCRRCGKPL